MRIATWNVNSMRARLDRVDEWLSEVEPDVCCFQETKLADDAFPTAASRSSGTRSPITATVDGTASPSPPGSASTTSSAAFAASGRGRRCRRVAA